MSTRTQWLDWRGRVVRVLRLAREVCTDCKESDTLQGAIIELLETTPSTDEEPIPMRLRCPMCHELHIDEGEFATKAHHTHACQHCGEIWRPALVPTVGVRFLPGFKNS